jgi:hypothetical protein
MPEQQRAQFIIASHHIGADALHSDYPKGEPALCLSTVRQQRRRCDGEKV